MTDSKLASMKTLSPLRNSSTADSAEALVREQLLHFGIEPDSDIGRTMTSLTTKLYGCQTDLDQLWQITLAGIRDLDYGDRILHFNAKTFLSFQLAKLLDSLQNSSRRSYQSLRFSQETQAAKGVYPVFDNITAIFSATPVIARTATYIYACAEWIEDAFAGKELLLEIYSRLLNPTSVALANHVVDLEAGPYAHQYFAWNFNSGMAAIDATLSHLLGRDDIVISSRNIYGGAYQLIHDWFGKPSNLAINVETFDGYTVEDFASVLEQTKTKYADRLAAGRKIYVYLESPCNPHGYVLDVPGICELAHGHEMTVMLDATVGTPFLHRPLWREEENQRPDYVIHSYTKDMTGTGSVIAGGVIARNENMFIPKGQSVGDINWDQTMFWNVYYIKGAFLNADASFEVMQGLKTLSVRMLRKCINTKILAAYLASHPGINVSCNALPSNNNYALCQTQMFLGLPAPLFTFDMGNIPRQAFQRFFDCLAPTFGHMISLGQSNTIVSCPALTTHSELDEAALAAGELTPTTIRVAVGDEDPQDLIRHVVATAKATIDKQVPGFSDGFIRWEDFKPIVKKMYLACHEQYVDYQLSADFL